MPVRTPLWRSVAVITAAIAAAACGSDSSTGPKGATASATATQLDAVFSARLAAATSGGDSAIAYFIASYFELAPAYGARPASVNVTTGAGTAAWQGFTIELMEQPNGTDANTGDSTFLTVVYPNAALTTALIFETDYDSTGLRVAGADLIYDTDSVVTTLNIGASVAPHPLGAACALQTGLAADSILTSVTGSYLTCAAATFTQFATMVFAAAPGLDASLQNISMSDVTFNGVRFVYAYGTSIDRVPRGPTVAAAHVLHLSDVLLRHSRTH